MARIIKNGLPSTLLAINCTSLDSCCKQTEWANTCSSFCQISHPQTELQAVRPLLLAAELTKMTVSPAYKVIGTAGGAHYTLSKAEMSQTEEWKPSSKKSFGLWWMQLGESNTCFLYYCESFPTTFLLSISSRQLICWRRKTLLRNPCRAENWRPRRVMKSPWYCTSTSLLAAAGNIYKSVLAVIRCLPKLRFFHFHSSTNENRFTPLCK